MSYKFTMEQIDNGYQKISDFDDETLFENSYHYWCCTNYYHYWCCTNYMSMYYIWRHTGLDRLKTNIKRK